MVLLLVHHGLQLFCAEDCIDSIDRPFPPLKCPVSLGQVGFEFGSRSFLVAARPCAVPWKCGTMRAPGDSGVMSWRDVRAWVQLMFQQAVMKSSSTELFLGDVC